MDVPKTVKYVVISSVVISCVVGLIRWGINSYNSNPVEQIVMQSQDLELRREIFNECLASVPKGPTSVKYNDWEEVVSACGDQADTLSTVDHYANKGRNSKIYRYLGTKENLIEKDK